LVLNKFAIVASAVLSGLILDWLFNYFNWQLNLSHGKHSAMIGVVYQGSGLILAGLIMVQVQKRYLPNVFHVQ
jgi:hypothetical protein